MIGRRAWGTVVAWVALAGGSSHCGGDPAASAETETQTETDATSTGAEESSTGEVVLCGNGEMDPDEDCDDGNAINGDGCNNDCKSSMRLHWVTAVDGGSGSDCAEGVAVDGAGNVVAVGFVTAGGGEDIWIGKWDPAGKELWTQTVDGPGGGNDRARGVAAGEGGEIVVIGFVTGETTEGRNIWVRGLDASGETVWTAVHDGSFHGDDQGYGVAAGPDAFVVVGEETVDAMDTDVWIRKYDNTGAETWSASHGGDATALDGGRGVAVGPDGEVVITGWETIAEQGRMVWVRKYDPAGEVAWTQTFNAGSSSGNLGNAVAVTSTGAVVVTGSSREGTDSTDIWTRMYDAAGAEVWTDAYASLGDSPDVGRGVAISSIDQVTVVATFLDDTSGQTRLRLAHFMPDGEQLWAEPFTGVDKPQSEGFAVAIDAADDIVFAGCQFAPGEDGSGDILVAKLAP